MSDYFVVPVVHAQRHVGIIRSLFSQFGGGDPVKLKTASIYDVLMKGDKNSFSDSFENLEKGLDFKDFHQKLDHWDGVDYVGQVLKSGNYRIPLSKAGFLDESFTQADEFVKRDITGTPSFDYFPKDIKTIDTHIYTKNKHKSIVSRPSVAQYAFL